MIHFCDESTQRSPSSAQQAAILVSDTDTEVQDSSMINDSSGLARVNYLLEGFSTIATL
jgi:hypothetical protein